MAAALATWRNNGDNVNSSANNLLRYNSAGRLFRHIFLALRSYILDERDDGMASRGAFQRFAENDDVKMDWRMNSGLS